MAYENVDARLAKLEQDLPGYERELLNFRTSIESTESRLILRTTELERRISQLERRNRLLVELVTGILSALIVASVAYLIQGETSPWGVLAVLGFFAAFVLTGLYFRWVAPE